MISNNKLATTDLSNEIILPKNLIPIFGEWSHFISQPPNQVITMNQKHKLLIGYSFAVLLIALFFISLKLERKVAEADIMNVVILILLVVWKYLKYVLLVLGIILPIMLTLSIRKSKEHN